MKKSVILSLAAVMLLGGCGSYTGSGALTGATLGSVIGSAIGGIAGGPRGSDVGTLVGIAGGAVVGGAVGGLSCPDYDGFLFGPAADLGFGITFRGAPVTLGLDYRPVVAFVVGGNSGVVTQGFWNFGLTLTYRF